MQILDAGRTWAGGSPPEHLEWGGVKIPNPNRDRPPGTALGAEQKRWWKETMSRSDATWKVWANSYGTMSRRTDLHNLPAALRSLWPGDGYGVYGNDDWECYDAERAELLRFVRDEGIGSFVSLSGDRHNFTAGTLSASLEPGAYDPVGVELGVSSLTTPTSFEAFEYVLSTRPELEPFFIRRREEGHEPVINLLFTHGVAAALAYADTGDLDAALARSNPEVAPHLSLLDMGSHGFATVRISGEELETELTAVHPPLTPVDASEGPPVKYRIVHRTRAWSGGEAPVMEWVLGEGDLPFPVRGGAAESGGD
jgi:alkaline phosphatase D